MTAPTDRVALIGVDVGSTNIKAAAYAPDGELLAETSCPTNARRVGRGWGEYDPEGLIDSVQELLREVVRRCEDVHTSIAGIAVASMAETAVPVDGAGHPTHPAIAWWDERGLEQARELTRLAGLEWWYERAGLRLSPVTGVSKILWFAANEPDAFARTTTWLNVADYVAYRLCGVSASDASLAGRVGLLDLRTGNWSDELLDAAGLDKQLLAPIVASGQPLGKVTPDAARSTGLPHGTIVGVGGMDHPVAALGAGCHRPGDVLDSMGTAEAVVGITATPTLTPEVARRRYQQGPNVVPGTSYVIGGLATGGGAATWLTRLLHGGSGTGEDVVALVDAARDSAPGSDGLVFLPYLHYAPAPLAESSARGSIVGLSTESRPADVARSLFEGMAHGIRFVIDAIVEDFGIDPSRLVAVGGGLRNDVLVQAKAALAGGHLDVQRGETACKGAALLAGVAAGVYRDHAQAVKAAVRPPEPIVVSPELVERYLSFHEERFLTIQAALAPHFSLWS